MFHQRQVCHGGGGYTVERALKPRGTENRTWPSRPSPAACVYVPPALDVFNWFIWPGEPWRKTNRRRQWKQTQVRARDSQLNRAVFLHKSVPRVHSSSLPSPSVSQGLLAKFSHKLGWGRGWVLEPPFKSIPSPPWGCPPPVSWQPGRLAPNCLVSGPAE